MNPLKALPPEKLARQHRRILSMAGFDPAKMTKAQIREAVKALTGFTRECSDPNANRRRPAALEALRKLYATAPTKKKRRTA